jgi:glycosyltransferase involved in cell wall biosynthesis
MSKIFHVAPALSIGGAEMFLASICNTLKQDGISQRLISLSDSNPLRYAFDQDIPMTILPRKGKLDFSPLSKLRGYVSHERPDIIFCLNFFSYAFCRVAAFGADTDSRYIISYHSTIHLSRKDHLFHKLFCRMVRNKDKVIMVSANQAEYTIRHYALDPARVAVIHNGVDTHYWHPPDAGSGRKGTRERYGIPENAKVIIMTASFRPEKNHAEAVKALGIVHGKGLKDTYLLLVGDGATRAETEALATSAGLADHIRFTGAQKDVRSFLWCSDLFTLTSNGVETFSIAALEAMSCGLPCVLTDIGGASEMITPGLNGALCQTNAADIADKWAAVLGQGLSADRIHGHIRERFDKDRMMDAYRNAFGITVDAPRSSNDRERQKTIDAK